MQLGDWLEYRVFRKSHLAGGFPGGGGMGEVVIIALGFDLCMTQRRKACPAFQRCRDEVTVCCSYFARVLSNFGVKRVWMWGQGWHESNKTPLCSVFFVLKLRSRTVNIQSFYGNESTWNGSERTQIPRLQTYWLGSCYITHLSSFKSGIK